MQLLTLDNRERLEAQGFDIAELTGFDDHSVPLYAHRPMADKKPGDVVVRARVGNPDALGDGEAVYLARKAFHGLFPWLPGADCVKRTFFDLTISENAGSEGPRVQRSKSTNGCKWCRTSVQRRSSSNAG